MVTYITDCYTKRPLDIGGKYFLFYAVRIVLYDVSAKYPRVGSKITIWPVV